MDSFVFLYVCVHKTYINFQKRVLNTCINRVDVLGSIYNNFHRDTASDILCIHLKFLCASWIVFLHFF